MKLKKILLTGSSGVVGSCVMAGLEQLGIYEVIGGDIEPDLSAGGRYLDVTNYESCRELMNSVDTVIHLAYQMKTAGFADALQVNYLGIYNIYEAAKQSGVKRVIFGSSNHTVGLYTPDDEVTADSAYRPSNLYALSKCHGELLGRLYSDKYDISSINVRIGTFSLTPPSTLRQLRTWISGRDMVELTRCCIEADENIKFLNLFGVSNNRDKYWDIEYLEDLIGYRPEDDGGLYVREDTVRDADELKFQGGFSAFRRSI
jgi:uronate dehydrogenase